MHTKTNIFHSLKTGLLISLLAIVLSHSHLFAQEPRLLFKSSFGGTTAIDKSGYHELVGSEDGYAWPYGLPGDNYRVGEGAAGRYFNYICDLNNYQEFVDTRIDDVIVPGSTAKKALYMEYKKDDPNMSSMTRNNYAFRPDADSSDPAQRYDQMYYKYKMKQHITSGTWKNMGQMKSESGDSSWTLYIYDANTASPYWRVMGQDGVDGNSPIVWLGINRDVPVPLDEWFELEIFVVHSTDPLVGKFKMAINGVVVFDITGRTMKSTSSRPISFWAFKNYGAVGYQWITDFEMWDKPPVTSVLSQEYQSGSTPEIKPESGSFIIAPGVLK